MIIYSHKETVKDQLSMYETYHSNNCISSDRDVMVNFKPGEYMRNVFSVRATGGSEEKIQVLPVRVGLMTFQLLVEMCH